MAFPEPEQLKELIEPELARRGLDVEDVKTTKAGKKSQVVIRIDGDIRPTSDDLEEVSQQLGEFFDAAETEGTLNFGAGYTLEVSTPGVDLPLSAPRHFRRNRLRRAKITLRAGTDDAASGAGATSGAGAGDGSVWRLGALSEDETQVVLVAAGKKGVRVRVERLENIAHAVVEIEFSQPAASEVEVAELTFDKAAELAARED